MVANLKLSWFGHLHYARHESASGQIHVGNGDADLPATVGLLSPVAGVGQPGTVSLLGVNSVCSTVARRFPAVRFRDGAITHGVGLTNHLAHFQVTASSLEQWWRQFTV
ncbi:MAG: hypothetical protein AAF514_12915 [Verrucomicrobiota bacterium]